MDNVYLPPSPSRPPTAESESTVKSTTEGTFCVEVAGLGHCRSPISLVFVRNALRTNALDVLSVRFRVCDWFDFGLWRDEYLATMNDSPATPFNS